MNTNRTVTPKQGAVNQSTNKDQLVFIAAISGAIGVKGEVRLKSFTASPTDCAAYGPLYDTDGKLVLTPKSSRAVKGGVAIIAPEITSREQAQALKSTRLYVPRRILPEPEEEEFYYTDLIGLKVENQEGELLGRIKTVHNFGAGDVLEVQSTAQKDWYHPFTQAGVPRVDIPGGRVVIIIDEAQADEGEENPPSPKST